MQQVNLCLEALEKNYIAGVDEAGRGPLAGDVYAAAVILDPDYPIEGLTDSKKLSEKKREFLALQIKEHALAYCIASATVEEIDQINILQATLLAMKRAVEGLKIAPNLVKIDGNHAPKMAIACETIIKGDLTEPCISAASILAKTARDAAMLVLDQQYPQYQLAKHKGYGTKLHLKAIEEFGVASFHRKSFAPIKLKIAELSG